MLRLQDLFNENVRKLNARFHLLTLSQKKTSEHDCGPKWNIHCVGLLKELQRETKSMRSDGTSEAHFDPPEAFSGPGSSCKRKFGFQRYYSINEKSYYCFFNNETHLWVSLSCYCSDMVPTLRNVTFKAAFSGKQQDKSRIRDHFFSSSAKLLKKSMIIDTTHEIA